jgi:crotonobetainyl-CoA:carnitine CoA-transferase CaiB-like acyl-CoA transferase
MCTRMLADAGADVVKVEPPEGDIVRQREPLRAGVSTYYASMNCGKQSIVLDLQTADGKRLARELVAQADVVVENFRPGVMKRLGLDYARSPRRIRASSTRRSPASARADRWPRRRPMRR